MSPKIQDPECWLTGILSTDSKGRTILHSKIDSTTGKYCSWVSFEWLPLKHFIHSRLEPPCTAQWTVPHAGMYSSFSVHLNVYTIGLISSIDFKTRTTLYRQQHHRKVLLSSFHTPHNFVVLLTEPPYRFPLFALGVKG